MFDRWSCSLPQWRNHLELGFFGSFLMAILGMSKLAWYWPKKPFSSEKGNLCRKYGFGQTLREEGGGYLNFRTHDGGGGVGVTPFFGREGLLLLVPPFRPQR